MMGPEPHGRLVIATGNFVSLMGAGLMEKESDEVVIWAPLRLLPPGLLTSGPSSSSRSVGTRKTPSDSDINEDDGWGDGKSEDESSKVEEWKGEGGSTEHFTMEESSTAGGHHGSKSSTTGAKEAPEGKWLGFLDLTEPGSMWEHGIGGDRKRRKVDIAKTAHVIDLTEDDEGNG